MRKIEKQAKEAFYKGLTFRGSNTSVSVINWGKQAVSKYYLHGNLIAEFYQRDQTLKVFDAGWQSNTTKSRLNSLLPNDYFITQKNWTWYIYQGDNRLDWDGSFSIKLDQLC